MQYNILLILSLLLFISIENPNAQCSLAVSAGFNSGYSQLNNVDHINTRKGNSHTSFYTGIIPSYQLSEIIQVSSELQYSEVGTYFNIHNFTPENNIKFYAEGRYIRLIPQLEVFILENLSVNGGLNFGVLIDSKSTTYANMRRSEDMPHYGDLISTFDIGASVGMKYHIKPFFLNLSYYQGIGDISKATYTNMNGAIIPNTSQRNHYVQFGLGATLFSNYINSK